MDTILRIKEITLYIMHMILLEAM